ncbi:MAG: hypothetical protein HY785_17155 [Oscillatoriophycideae cyanobacterium NC_groundwater_1537_Pr4_S-0.65um_50_18]|nr:hypothetical protein [Oscillatoriophycideae cyanobacterium NC_groundwater_1537_Pr4_S-0.65um_50_18]
MGIFLDTVEDNAERGWDVEVARYLRENSTTGINIALLEICPRCLKHFRSRESLQDHIFYDHRNEEILLRIGDVAQTVKRNSISIEVELLEQEKEVFLRNQELLASNQRIELDQLNFLINAENIKIFIQQYRRGIFGYLDALYFEKSPQLSTHDTAPQRLESVYGYLQPFNDSLSRQIRMSIAFRFNWFNSLRYASRDSIFYLAHIFFSNSYDAIQSICLPIEDKRRKAYGVYLSESSEYLLQLIELFCNERINKARFQQILQKLKPPDNPSRSYAEKLNLVLARIHRKLNNEDEAFQQYRSLSHSKLFSSEAQEYVRISRS